MPEEQHEHLITSFEKEIAAFEQMKPTLFTQYADQYVAIYQGEVVAYGREKLPLLDEVRERFGLVVCYIGQVTHNEHRTVRIPSPKRYTPDSDSKFK
ncbi:MAG: hypothetical protein KDE51_05575 [Anaerolineales bacterium]|nr:hypothetical protein [Anaerolineales bacterium]